MSTQHRSVAFCLLTLLLAACPMLHAQSPLTPHGILPQCTAVLIDGDLTDWTGVPPIRMGRAEQSSTPLQWHGAQDASMTLLYARNDEGLFIAGQVSDADTVLGQDLQRADGLELFLTLSRDPRINHLSKGVLRATILPPAPQKAATVAFSTPPQFGTEFRPVEIKGTTTPGGYTFELFMPWEYLSDGEPDEDAILSVMPLLHDADPKRVYPQLLTRAPDGSGARTFTRLALGTRAEFATVSTETLRLYSNVAYPTTCTTPTIPYAVELAPQLLKDTTVVTLALLHDGKPLLTKTNRAKDFSRQDGILAVATAAFDAAKMEDGTYEMGLTLGTPAGATTITQPITLLAGAPQRVTDTIARLDAMHLNELAVNDPFKASAAFGVVAAVEWLKWGIEQKQAHAMLDASAEIRARLAVLDGAPIADTDSMYSLLALTGTPEAQFVVEYIRERTPLYPRKASVAVYWGMFPLMTAHVSEYTTAQEATDAVRKLAGSRFATPITIGDVPCLKVQQVKPTALTWEAFAPERYALMTSGQKAAEAIPLNELGTVNADAVLFFEECPADARAQVERWAQAATIPVISPQATKGYTTILYVGKPDDSPAARPFKGATLALNAASPVTGTLYFTRGRLAVMLPYVSLDAPKTFTRVILEGKPGTLAQADSIRQAIVKATGRTPSALKIPDGMQVFCGDLHTHSFLSDGRPTPLTVTAEAVYCGLDMHILSDHGVFGGAIRHRESLEKYGLRFEAIPGVEMNSRWGHLNIYPIKTGIPLGPTRDDMVKAAHDQQAVIQWNHPQLENENALEDFAKGIAGTGLDAWEHLPPQYTAWKQAGTLPVLTGGTDTHDGTFSMPERTFVLAPANSGQDIAEAVRRGNVLLVDPWNGSYGITRKLTMCYDWNDLYFYGSDRMIQLGVDVLADARYAKALKKQRVTDALRHVDIKALIASSSAYETVK